MFGFALKASLSELSGEGWNLWSQRRDVGAGQFLGLVELKMVFS